MSQIRAIQTYHKRTLHDDA